MSQEQPAEPQRYRYSSELLLEKVKLNKKKDWEDNILQQSEHQLTILKQAIASLKKDQDKIKTLANVSPRCLDSVLDSKYKLKAYCTTLKNIVPELERKYTYLNDAFLNKKNDIVSQIIVSNPTDLNTVEWLSDENNRQTLYASAVIPSSCDKHIIDKIIQAINGINEEEKKRWEKYVDTKIRSTIQTMEHDYKRQFEEGYKPQTQNDAHRSIVWGIPSQYDYQDDFVYSSKSLNPNKTVPIPYKAIHQKLAESNWLMQGYIVPTCNYLCKRMGKVVLRMSKFAC